MSQLNPQQQLAVDTIDGPLLINAGAGSGKTHTLTERVVSMIRDHHIDPHAIFCVTFTNKAAREMQERMAQKLGVELTGTSAFRDKRLPMIGTFHSTAAFFLRMFIDRVGYGKDFVIYDSDDVLRLVKLIMREQNVNEKEFNPRAIYGMISRAKNDGLSPNEYAPTVDSYAKSVALDVYRVYAGKMHEQNALDFDDLLLLFRQILDDGEVLEYFHARFRYFLVDEYQDTNLLQYEIIRILASHTRNLCVVGDDWQGIYSWRGANIENILSFQKDYPEAKIINLEENYRSTKNIINAANAVIKNNSRQMKKTLFTEKEDGAKITLIEAQDDSHEAALIVEKIREMSDRKYSDFAVLYRTNGQSRQIEEALIRKNIPYRVFGGVKFYERKEIKDILAYIRLIFNPHDAISLRRIVNVPSRKIGEKSLEQFESVLAREHLSIAEFAEDAMLLDSLSGIGTKGIQAFSILYRDLRDFSMKNSVAALMEAIIKRTEYDAYLKAEYDENEYNGKLENLDEFISMASRYDGLIYPENLALFLEDIALITDQDRENSDQENNEKGFVSLMTVHLAKGLEFPIVFIAGTEEGIFPHSRSLTESNALEEERRLMYVAITRAKDALYIARAYERYSFGSYTANPKSRFIKEIPEEFLEYGEHDNNSKSIFGGGSAGFSGFGTLFSGAPIASTPKIGAKKHSESDFTLGDRVRHPQYGKGTLIAKNGNIAEIAFSGMGIKKLNIEFAPIEKIN